MVIHEIISRSAWVCSFFPIDSVFDVTDSACEVDRYKFEISSNRLIIFVKVLFSSSKSVLSQYKIAIRHF